MAPQSDTITLEVQPREPSGSRSARRLRREGAIPGVVYGGTEEPIAFRVDARELRHALVHGHAVIDLKIGSGASGPVLVKEVARHPVSGEAMHLDLLRVRLDQKLQATVALELTGADEAPGVRENGILEHVTRELTIEALPNDIPDAIQHDVSGMAIGDTLTLQEITPPAEVTLLDDPETVIATITPPRLQAEVEEEIEAETEVVGEGETGEEAEAQEGEAGTSEAAEGDGSE